MKSKPLIAILLGLSALAAVAFLDYHQYNLEKAPKERALFTANGQMLASTVSIVSNDPIPTNGVTPANILFFEAERYGTETLLLWDAVDELELVGYQVEKSIGTQPFKRIGWVYSREISRELSYEFSDTSPTLNEPCFYRLKMVDFDGAEAYSPVISSPAVNH